MPLQGMTRDEIIEVAARAEKKRQQDDRRRETAAILLFLLGLLGFGVYITVQMNQLEAAQLEEIREAELQAQTRSAENAVLLAEIEDQLVPRRDFLVLESQMRQARAELRQVKRELRQQSRQLRRIERGVARLTGSG